jgi:sorbitol-specific phosphotransferase system component IIA
VVSAVGSGFEKTVFALGVMALAYYGKVKIKFGVTINIST